jgi:hyperosmotically inducible periplasmic protein
MHRSIVALLRIVLAAWAASSITLVVGTAWPLAESRQQQKSSPQSTVEYLKKEVRHELLTLPWYGIFDWLEAEIKDQDTVILRGYVVRPTTKSDAESRVNSIEGVENVINEIEVLPVSPNDDRLRRALYATLFNWDSPLMRYSMGANPSIHIIVRNGHATLKGVVVNEMDSQLAYTRAHR